MAPFRKALRFGVPSLFSAAVIFGCVSHSFARSAADVAFERAAKSCLDDYLRLNPVEATQLGDHRFDDTLAVYSVDGIKENLALMQRHLSELTKINESELTGPNRTDAQILRLSLEGQI